MVSFLLALFNQRWFKANDPEGVAFEYEVLK
jgi:hypothetical protein